MVSYLTIIKLKILYILTICCFGMVSYLTIIKQTN